MIVRSRINCHGGLTHTLPKERD